MPKTLTGAQEMISLGLQVNRPLVEPEPKGGTPLSPEVAERVRLLLRGLAIHLPKCDLADSATFQQQLNAAADTLNGKSTARDLELIVALALKAAKEFEARYSQVANEDSSALRRMVQSVMEALRFISGSNETGLKRLAFIENKLMSVPASSDLKPLLEQCIHLLRQECQRLQTQTHEKLAALHAEVELLSRSLNVSRVVDPTDSVTGLPGRAAAEEAIHEVIRGGRGFLVALFVVKQLMAVNGQYGRETGDDMLLMVARTLAAGLPEVRLCRWNGPALLAVFAPKADRLVAEKRAKDLADQKWEKTVTTEQGEQIVTVTCGMKLQWFSSEVACESIFRSFDTFLSHQ